MIRAAKDVVAPARDQNGERPRARRPASPLRPTAREELRNGLLSSRPSPPGAEEPAREPTPSTR